jgi:hypothetical protein
LCILALGLFEVGYISGNSRVDFNRRTLMTGAKEDQVRVIEQDEQGK